MFTLLLSYSYSSSSSSSVHTKILGPFDVFTQVAFRHTWLAALQGTLEVVKGGLEGDQMMFVLKLLHVAFEVFLAGVFLLSLERSKFDDSFVVDLFPDSNFVQGTDGIHEGIIEQIGQI